MRKNNPTVTEASQPSPEREVLEKRKRLEESLKRYKKSRILWTAYTFIIIITAAMLIPSAIAILTISLVESYTLRIVIVFVSGMVGLLGSVGYFMSVEEKRRISCINAIRISEKEFFDRMKRDVSSRLAEKAH